MSKILKICENRVGPFFHNAKKRTDPIFAERNKNARNIIQQVERDEIIEELKKIGYNVSITHVDFMFGSADMQIVGTTHDGKEVVIFEKGNFVI